MCVGVLVYCGSSTIASIVHLICVCVSIHVCVCFLFSQEGCEAVDEVVASYADVGIKDRSLVWNTDLMEALELENLLINGILLWWWVL